jgi:23S rRNA (guanosine2251-2'-O)-methyltransferase
VRAIRRQLAGIDAIAAAIGAGEPLRVLLVQRGDPSVGITELVALAQSHGVHVWQGSAGDLRRMSRGPTPEHAIAMLGPAVEADLASLFTHGGAVWLLHRAAYPSNVGFAIRTAEVSGADGVVVDGTFNHDERSRISHVSMGADRLLPVLWESTERTLIAARASGHRVIAVEGGGTAAPWEHDLTGAVVLLVGNERDGIAPELLADCDAIATIPMTGFVPSYNLQAAISAVAAERLRQLGRRAADDQSVTR